VKNEANSVIGRTQKRGDGKIRSSGGGKKIYKRREVCNWWGDAPNAWEPASVGAEGGGGPDPFHSSAAP